MSVLSRSVGRRRWRPALLVGFVLACGGNVNLGGERGSSASGAFVEPGSNAGNPEERSEIAARFAPQFHAYTMAVSGQYLYIGGFDDLGFAVVRCEKTRCTESARFIAVRGNLYSMQVNGDQLGVIKGEDDLHYLHALSTYRLPDVTGEQVAINELPSIGRGPLFHAGHVFWSMSYEEGLYRCSLPDCGTGPQRIHPFSASGPIYAEGDLVFWTRQGIVHRAEALGDQPARGLDLGSELTVTAPYDASVAIDTASEATAIAVGDGMLYAAVRATNCAEHCRSSLARWPIRGGGREMVVETEGTVTNVFVRGGEVAWVEREMSEEHGTLSTCLADSCVATRRELGTVMMEPVVVSDDASWFWFQAETQGTDDVGRTQWAYRQIRRTALLGGSK